MINELISMEAITPMIKTLVQKYIDPKLEKIFKKLEISYNEYMIPRREHFSEYLNRTYKKYSIINTFVLKNNQLRLKDIYEPLTLVKESEFDSNNEMILINGFPKKFVEKYQKILIEDTAGMGKSTITKLMFLDTIENGYGIPIYIELRKLYKARSIITEIHEQLNSINKDFDKSLLLEFIQTGDFVFFLDGFDEIAIDDITQVADDIKDFISKAGNNIFILTSRNDKSLAGFGDFQKTSIKPLKKAEAYNLLRKYDNQGEVSSLLIKELKTGKYSIIDEFLGNPLLVSLLYAAFDSKQTIPLKKHIFFRQVFDAYFDSHDLTKGGGYVHKKKCNLNSDQFEKILRYIGFVSIKKQKIEYTKDQLLEFIDQAKLYSTINDFSSSDFLHDLLTCVPLFCQDGLFYRWVHKSLQEYFAAQFIYKDAKQHQDETLTNIYNSDYLYKYMNLLDIYYDIDSISFDKNITLPLLKEFVVFYNENINKLYNIPIEERNIRISTTFKQNTILFSKDYDLDNVFQIIDQNSNILGHYYLSSISLSLNCLKHISFKKDIFIRILSKNKKSSKTASKNTNLNKLSQHINNYLIVGINTFLEDIDLYKECNSYITYDDDFIIDIELCKKEINRIENTLSWNENSDIFTIGF